MENVNNVCGLLKLWLRMLPEPILGDTDTITNIMNSKTDKILSTMSQYLKSLPSVNFNIIYQVIRTLYISKYFYLTKYHNFHF